jgi:PAS domain S-box-containing protein
MIANSYAQRQSRESMQTGRDTLEALFESIPEAVLVSDDKGSIVRVNAEAESLFGYSPDELRGQPIAIVLPERFSQVHLAHGHYCHQGPRRRSMGAGLEVCGRHKDGREFLIDLMRSPVETGQGTLFLSLIRDLSERAPSEALRFHLAALVNSSSDAIVGTTMEGVITSWNQSAERIFNYSAREAIGKPISMLLPPGSEDQELDILGCLKRGETINPYDAVRRRKDGRNIEVSVIISPIFDPLGNLVGASKVARDVTDRKRMETELEISRAQAVSSARLSALGMMAGSIAHEINNPIGVIHASVSDLIEMAETGTVPLTALESASRRIQRTANRISKIVKSLRQISREGSGDPFQRASVAEIVEQALELCKERFRVHSVRLETPVIEPGLSVFCREVQIAQVLLNLLQNAFDAVAERAGDKWIRLEVRSLEKSIVFAVTDSGNGVPADLKARIMEPFFTTKPVGKGTGLGLSLSKAIVEEHGGELKVSEVENHTCFSFFLPLIKETEHGS